MTRAKEFDGVVAEEHVRELYAFLDEADHKWTTAFLTGEAEFAFLLADDDDVQALAYRDAEGALCCAVILEECAILTAAFAGEATPETFATVLADVETAVGSRGYADIWYGAGNDSFGVYSREGEENAFGSFLKQNGFVLESVSYDVKHDTSSIRCEEPGICRVEKSGPAALAAYDSAELRRFPGDRCYLAVGEEDGMARGYVLLDPRSCVMDRICIFDKSPARYRAIKRALLAAVAADLRDAGMDELIERNVDQLECQRIPHRFTVCGRYETLVGKCRPMKESAR